MLKKELIGLLLIFSFVFISGCDTLLKGGADGEETDFKRTSQGLVMNFVNNYPQERFIVGVIDEDITTVIDVKNKGTYPSQTSSYSLSDEEGFFKLGNIHLSGFDDEILKFREQVDTSVGGSADGVQFVDKNSESLSKLFLQPASPINPNGGFDTAEFVGKIIVNKIVIDEYEPTILATACYPYFTKASPTICIDPHPFDSRQEKVCEIGTTTLTSQGAPIAITKVEQEAATGKIQFKIHIKNVGNGDVIWDKDISEGLGNLDKAKLSGLLDRCSPVGGGILNRKDFDRVQLESVKIGNVPLFKDGKCGPFSDGTSNVVKLFDGEGFIICTLNVAELGNIQSAYTTPINIELRYAYRSTISKRIDIRKLDDTPFTGTSGDGLGDQAPTGETGQPTTCAAPTIPVNFNTRCFVSQNNVVFKWNSVPGATKYLVSWCPGAVGSDFDSSCPGYGDEESETSLKLVSGLDLDTNYNFKVYVLNSDETICLSTSQESEVGSCKSEVGITQTACKGDTSICFQDSECCSNVCDDDGFCAPSPDLKCAAPTIYNDINFRCSTGTGDTIGFNWRKVVGASEYNVSWCPGEIGEDFEVGDPNCDSEKVNVPSKVISGIEPNINYNYKVFVTESRENVCIPSGIESKIGSCATCGNINQECCVGTFGTETCRSGLICGQGDEDGGICLPV